MVQATHEAVVNSLIANADMTGRDGHFVPALPHAPLLALLGEAVNQTGPSGGGR